MSVPTRSNPGEVDLSMGSSPRSGKVLVVAFIAVAIGVALYFAFGMPGMDHSNSTSTMDGIDMSSGSAAHRLVDPVAFEEPLANSDAVVINVHVPHEGESTRVRTCRQLSRPSTGGCSIDGSCLAGARPRFADSVHRNSTAGTRSSVDLGRATGGRSHRTASPGADSPTRPSGPSTSRLRQRIGSKVVSAMSSSSARWSLRDLACSEDSGNGDRPLVTLALAKVASRTTSSTVARPLVPDERLMVG